MVRNSKTFCVKQAGGRGCFTKSSAIRLPPGAMAKLSSFRPKRFPFPMSPRKEIRKPPEHRRQSTTRKDERQVSAFCQLDLSRPDFFTPAGHTVPGFPLWFFPAFDGL